MYLVTSSVIMCASDSTFRSTIVRITNLYNNNNNNNNNKNNNNSMLSIKVALCSTLYIYIYIYIYIYYTILLFYIIILNVLLHASLYSHSRWVGLRKETS